MSNSIPGFTRKMLARRTREDVCAFLAALQAEDFAAARATLLAIGETFEDYEAAAREFFG